MAVFWTGDKNPPLAACHHDNHDNHGRIVGNCKIVMCLAGKSEFGGKEGYMIYTWILEWVMKTIEFPRRSNTLKDNGCLATAGDFHLNMCFNRTPEFRFIFFNISLCFFFEKKLEPIHPVLQFSKVPGFRSNFPSRCKFGAALPEPKIETQQSLLLRMFHGNWENQNSNILGSSSQPAFGRNGPHTKIRMKIGIDIMRWPKMRCNQNVKMKPKIN